jgi:hypothetical protein
MRNRVGSRWWLQLRLRMQFTGESYFYSDSCYHLHWLLYNILCLFRNYWLLMNCAEDAITCHNSQKYKCAACITRIIIMLIIMFLRCVCTKCIIMFYWQLCAVCTLSLIRYVSTLCMCLVKWITEESVQCVCYAKSVQ